MTNTSTKYFDNISYRKKRKEAEKLVKKINQIYLDYEKEYQDNDNFISEKSNEIKEKIMSYIDSGIDEEKALELVLPEAYALVKLACKEVLGKTYYDVQLMSGILLNDGYVSEMATGEGKTITAALPVYLNALLGKGAHVITPNVYLASRDYEYMKPLYEKLGLTCGLVEEQNTRKRHSSIQERSQMIYDRTIEVKKYTDNQKRILKQMAIRKAIETFKEKEIKDKQKQYKCDVTYGSAHAFAFDYLFDLLEDNPNKLRLRLGNPNYLVIDEADLVLFDDAITSYNISGDQTDSIFAIRNDEKKQREVNIRKATMALHYLVNNPILMREFNNRFEYEENLDDCTTTFDRNTPAINYCKKTKDYNVTYVGTNLFFRYFYFKEINEIFKNNKDRLLNLTYQGKHLFVPGKNYFPELDKFNIDPHTLSVIVRSNKIEELSELYNKFMLEDYFQAFDDISNTIYAWIFLQKDIDYKYTTPEKSTNPFEKKISILINGRVASGRVYSNGLQQAVETKEKTLIKQRKERTIIVDTKMNDILASIPVAAFFGRYTKFSGMTGTSAVEAFRDLYHIDTFPVPRNKPYNVVDHGDVLYRTTEEKNNAILEELLKSYNKGQPVLLTTTSVEESIKLYNYLISNLKECGINIDIPVLNANVESLDKEAAIIANAGKKGAITIATDMAGRGTDIKLGGENATEEEHDEIISLGGLKIIGSGHYKFRRSDRQVKGRTGRQGDLGEIIFFNDLDDLRRLNMSPSTITYLDHLLNNGPIKEAPSDKTLLQKSILECQEKAESLTKESILQTEKVEGPIAVCRNQLHNMTETIKIEDDYESTIKDMISVVIRDIYKASTANMASRYEINMSGKLSKAKLNPEMFKSLAEEFLGLRINDEVFNSFETNEELLDFIQNAAEKRLQKCEISKELINLNLRRIWLYFEDITDSIKKQYNVASMIPGSVPTSKIDPCIYEGFKYSYHSVYAQVVRDTLHSRRDKSKDHFGVFELNIKVDGNVQFLNYDEYQEVEEENIRHGLIKK